MGPAGREFARLGLRYAVVLRVVVVAVATAVALLAATPREPGVAVVVLLGFNGWNLGYAVLLRRGSRWWLLPADALAVSAVCLAQVWTHAAGAQQDGTNWSLVVASIVVVSWQWHLPVAPAMLATAVVVSGYLLGAALSRPAGWAGAVPLGLWMIAEAVLSRALFLLVARGARVADLASAQAGRARRAAALAAARRDDEREHLAAIHDTASATMLLVGLGVVRRHEPWLAAQAARDVRVIQGQADPATERAVEVAAAVRAMADIPLWIDWQVEESLTAPPVVANGFAYAAREALTNVLRHSGVESAVVRLSGVDGRIVLEVVDQGCGFRPEEVPASRYGLSRSIRERMARLGGLAEVVSSPGRGTRVRLEWSDGGV